MRYAFLTVALLVVVFFFPLPGNEALSRIDPSAHLAYFLSPMLGEKHSRPTAHARYSAQPGERADPRVIVETDFRRSPAPGPAQGLVKDPKLAQTAIIDKKILVVGDSLSISLGERLEEHFNGKKNIAFKRHGKVSSGLARPDFYDWDKIFPELAADMRPDVVVVMIGANDNQSVEAPGGEKYAFGGNGWEREYARRVQKLLDQAKAVNPKAAVFWMGAPVMANPQLNGDVRQINRVLADVCGKNRSFCRYIDTFDVLSDDQGRFLLTAFDAAGSEIKLRKADGVHLADSGAKLLAGRCLKVMNEVLGADAAKPAAKPAG